MEMRSNDFKSGLYLKQRTFWVEILSSTNSLWCILNLMKIWDKLRMSLNRWSSRAPQSETLTIRSSLKHLIRLIKIFKWILNIRIQHQLRGLIGWVKTIQSSPKPQHPKSHKGKSKLLERYGFDSVLCAIVSKKSWLLRTNHLSWSNFLF